MPGRFAQGEGAPGTHWIRGWVGPRTGLDAVEKRKISRPIYLHSPICLHGIVLNELSTGTTSPFLSYYYYSCGSGSGPLADSRELGSADQLSDNQLDQYQVSSVTQH
jgi:hypothetical protein